MKMEDSGNYDYTDNIHDSIILLESVLDMIQVCVEIRFISNTFWKTH
jgi:hypothetical protein